MSTRRKTKKSRQGPKKKTPLAPRKRGAGGKFLSKSDSAYAEKEVALWEVPTVNPIQERLARTRTKQGGSGRIHLRKAYKGKRRVETKDNFGAFEKLTLRLKGDSESIRNEASDFLKKHGLAKTTRSWVNIGTKEAAGNWYGSKADTAVGTESYLRTTGKQYGKRFGIEDKTKIILEIVVIRKRRI